ncbi:MAG: WYL domain-containing protein [Candidatus Gastranaerophilales bacterium]|nr:WYL domain-containing protein [Candidatus Gastranaerophilales bacterium]
MVNNYNQTSYNALLCLDYMLEHPDFDIDEVSEFLEKSNDVFYSKETILKYIRTFKLFGIDIKRKNAENNFNKSYKLVDFPVKIRFNNGEVDILEDIFTTLKSFYFSPNDYNVEEFADRIKLFLEADKLVFEPKMQQALRADNFNNVLLAKLKDLCKANQRLFVTKSDGTRMEFEPVGLTVLKNRLYCAGMCLKEKSNMLIDISDIKSVVRLPVKNKFSQYKVTVEFKLYGKLANSYTLKKGEKFLEKTPSYTSVQGKFNDKKLFFNRVLRYGKNCEIISPDFLRKDFYLYIKKIQSMY